MLKTLWPINIYEKYDVIDNDEITCIEDYCVKNTPRLYPQPLFFTHDQQSIHNNIEFKTLSNKIIECAQAYYCEANNVPIDDRKYLPQIYQILHMWFNVYKMHANMFPHDHHEVPVNGTFYVNNSDMATLFLNPNSNERNSYYASKSERGKMILWPGYLIHMVTPNQSDDLRITISFKLEYNFNTYDRHGRRKLPHQMLKQLIEENKQNGIIPNINSM